MRLTIRADDPELLADVSTWRYEPPYDFYDDDGEPVKNPERYFAARDAAGELVGFFYFECKGKVLEYGLGLRPDLCGQALGFDFFSSGLEFGRERFAPELVALNVASFNERAIKVYTRAGFRCTGRHVRTFRRWGDVEFVEMEEAR